MQLPSLFRRSARDSRRQAPRRPQLEALEDRVVPATLYVVPSGQPGFHTIQSAVAAASNGDVIQIEPFQGGSGNSVTDNTLSTFTTTITQAQLTIQGDPNAALAEIPTITGNNFVSPNQPALRITSSGAGIVLNHLNLRNGIQLDAGSHGTVIENSNIDGVTEVGGASGNGQNYFFNNTFTGNIALKGNAPATVTGDQVLYNHFIPNPLGGLPGNLSVVNDTGAMIRGNTFDAGFNPTALLFVGAGGTAANPVTVYDNHVAAVAPAAILVSDADAAGANSAATFVNVLNNYAQTDNGTGLKTVAVNPANLSVRIQGNDLRNNNLGLWVVGTSAGLGTVDAGGGVLGSYGANNFRGFTGPNALTRAAIRLTGTTNGPLGPSNTLEARNNIFSSSLVGNPGRVVSDDSDPHGGGGNGLIDVTALDDAHAFVQTLYLDFLHRSANPATGADLDGWAGLDKSAGQVTVANAIAGSHEAHQRAVDDLYIKFLGRFANNSVVPVVNGEDAGAIAMLDNGTATLDQVEIGLLSSTEFFNRARGLARNVTTPDLDTPSSNYVQALYEVLLGRQASAGERAGWVNQLPSLGLGGIANAFVKSEEYRTDVIDRLYGFRPAVDFAVDSLVPNLLHRQSIPSATDISNWANTTMDLYAIETVFAGGTEFFAQG
jgi:hypothetical protein